MIDPHNVLRRVGSLRPNQLLHTYGVGAMADLPFLSVVMMGLEHWDRERSTTVPEERLLGAVRAKLGRQVDTLRLPPHLPETSDQFGEWTRVGVPVGLFPNWLRCSDCNRLGHAAHGLFERVDSAYRPEQTRYVHDCGGDDTTGRAGKRRAKGSGRPVAVPARFIAVCEQGHLDDFPWQYFVHRGQIPDSEHTLKIIERGSTGEAADVFVHCSCDARRPMSDAFGDSGAESLPRCRGRHPHLGTFNTCTNQVRTMVLGATNSWFPMQLRAITLPRADERLDHLIAEYWGQLSLLVSLGEQTGKQLMTTQTCWPQLETFGADEVWKALQRHSERDEPEDEVDELDLRGPEWRAFTDPVAKRLTDFTTQHEPVPSSVKKAWLHSVVLVPRLREVAALYGFTRVDAPEWEVQNTPANRSVRLSGSDLTWVPCAELRGEGIFLRLNEKLIADWEVGDGPRRREREELIPGYKKWCRQRGLRDDAWPGLRYVLLHTLSHVLIRELALESGYGAAGIGERIYARTGDEPMAGLLLYTAAPDSEGTLGGLVSLGRKDRLGAILDRALEAAELCSSDPLCAEHDPTVHGRLHGAACHACLFASETSCERGNQFLDRALLVETLAGKDSALSLDDGATTDGRSWEPSVRPR